jgi:hypothetical protein
MTGARCEARERGGVTAALPPASDGRKNDPEGRIRPETPVLPAVHQTRTRTVFFRRRARCAVVATIPWRGLLGLALILLGLAVVGLNVRESLDPVVLSLSASHGIHLTDPLGSAIVFAGAWLVWTR